MADCAVDVVVVAVGFDGAEVAIETDNIVGSDDVELAVDDDTVVGVDIEVAATTDGLDVGSSIQTSLKAQFLYQINVKRRL